jgi:hypothetical protein
MLGVEGSREEERFKGEGVTQLKFGPGKAWMMARPRRKSRGETQPSATTYLDGRF